MQEVTNAIRQMRFPQKLWYLLDLHTNAILWGGTGRTILLNYRVLHSYLQSNHTIFKTTNISSFVRQLNLYGFRKVTSHLQDPLCNSSNPYMHEYVHDYFLFGRPELLNKITRKALTIKKNFKPKNLYGNHDRSVYVTPLQKARLALQIALKKVAQDLYSPNSPKQSCNTEYDDEQDDYQHEENIEVDWLIPCDVSAKDIQECTQTDVEEAKGNDAMDEGGYGDISHDNLIVFSDDSCQQVNDTYSAPFMNMPDLDSEPTEENPRVELLAEFYIGNDIDQGITKIKKERDNNSLNCVLPSVSNDQNDDISFVESNEDTNHYHGEWDQMFPDIMMSKSSSQDNVSNLKELYSQISQTIDLLNS